MRKKEERTVLRYMRTHRRVWGLTVSQLTSLLGFRAPSYVSKIESGGRPPSLDIALACQVIFGVPPRVMFPDVYARVEDGIMWNIAQMHLALEDTTNPAGLRKRALCELALKRAMGNPEPQPEV